ncbi:MAG TPA: ABC transporter substrate-binding protein [Stellaceae bacterium]|nr:ABC transporter substrate-binding protein [Stellaceae bacterium]
MVKARLAWFLAAIGCAGILFAGTAVPRVQAADEHATMALPAPVVLFLTIYAAQDYFWPKEGLDINLLNIPGVGSMNAVIAGSAEFSISSSGSITRAAAHGQKLITLATLNNESGQFIALRQDIAEERHFDPKAPFAERGKMLKGLTIATAGLGSVADSVIRITLHAAGLDPEKDATIAPMQPPDILAALARKSLGAFSLGPPFAQQAVHDGTAVILVNGSEGDPPGYAPLASSLLVARPQLCVERRALCEKLGHSIVEAATYIHEHRDGAIASLKKRFPNLADAVLADSADAVIAMTDQPPASSAKAIANGDRMNADAGFLKPDELLKSYDDLFTNEYLK